MDKSASYHEAGHAIVNMLFGLRVKRVTITPQCGSRVRSQPEDKPLTEVVAIFASGAAAEGRPQGTPRRCFNSESWGAAALSDHACARSTIATQPDISANEADYILEAAMNAVFEFMEDPGVWASVEELAEQLYARGSLTGDDVQAVWARHPKAHEAGSRLTARVGAIDVDKP
jgi:hypothetical protein